MSLFWVLVSLGLLAIVAGAIIAIHWPKQAQAPVNYTAKTPSGAVKVPMGGRTAIGRSAVVRASIGQAVMSLGMAVVGVAIVVRPDVPGSPYSNAVNLYLGIAFTVIAVGRLFLRGILPAMSNSSTA